MKKLHLPNFIYIYPIGSFNCTFEFIDLDKEDAT